MWGRSSFYYVKPFIPRRLQLVLRRWLIFQKLKKCKEIWPIDPRAGDPPKGWSGWPEKKQFSLVLTHDVDTAKGQGNCQSLIDIEENLGFRSSFNFVPERYQVSEELRRHLTANGFEVGVHGLNHDGKLYNSRKLFEERAHKINFYLKQWEAVGFRSPAMHHNLEWIHELNIEYDSSTFDTDPFEPQSDGMGTIYPFWVSNAKSQKGYLELPYTLPQDFTVFILMKESTIDVWKKKLDWIAERGGMALLNIHPDYMGFEDGKLEMEEYSASYYEDFLKYIKTEYAGQYWHVLPKDVTSFWKLNVLMRKDRLKN